MTLVEARAKSDRPAAVTAIVAVGLAMVGCALLGWGRSSPGFPVDVAVVMLLCAVTAVVVAATSRARAVATTAVVMVALGLGVATAALRGDRLLQARWSASTSDFEAYVAQLPPPSAYAHGGEGATFHSLPADAPCPARLGEFRLGECVSLDSGYLFLQASSAVTDSSGIAYLPAGNDAARTGLDGRDLTPLGGAWWSWTCHC